MRKLFIALVVLYVMAMGQSAHEYWQSYQLSLDLQPISGQVIECEQHPPVQDSVMAAYAFEVGGKRYQGTVETTPVKVGSEVSLYYSPSNPELNSANLPDFTMERIRRSTLSLTMGFAFWAALFEMVAWLRRRT